MLEPTKDEILEQFGPLILDALRAFATDPLYFGETCEEANRIEAATTTTPDRVKELTKKGL